MLNFACVSELRNVNWRSCTFTDNIDSHETLTLVKSKRKDETVLTPEIISVLEDARNLSKALSKHHLGKTVGAGAAGQLLEELVGYEVVREAGFATGLRAVVWTSLCIDFIRFKSNKAQTQNA